MSAGEQAGDRQTDDVVVADDALADLAGDVLEAIAKLLDRRADGGSGHCLRMKYDFTAARRDSGTGGGAVELPRSAGCAAACVKAAVALASSVLRRSSVGMLSPC